MSKSDSVSDAGYKRPLLGKGLLLSLLTLFKDTLAAFPPSAPVEFPSYAFLKFSLVKVVNVTNRITEVRPIFFYVQRTAD